MIGSGINNDLMATTSDSSTSDSSTSDSSYSSDQGSGNDSLDGILSIIEESLDEYGYFWSC